MASSDEPRTFRELIALLLPEAARLGLLRWCADNPDLGCSFYLETRLGAGVGRVDLLASLTPACREGALEHLQPATTRAEAGLEPEPSAGLLRFLRAWNDPSSPLNQRIPVAWLEYDDIQDAGGHSPNVCACIAPSYCGRGTPIELQPAEVLATLADLTELVLGHPASDEEHEGLARAVHALPPNASFIHFSIMRARTPVQLKLYGAFPQDALLPYLDTIGWTGNFDGVRELLARYCPKTRTGGVVYVDLRVSGLYQPSEATLGISFSQQQLNASEERDTARRALLRALCRGGLCTSSQLEALKRWPTERSSPWTLGREPQLGRRWLDVKLVTDEDGAHTAKAYLGFSAGYVRSLEFRAPGALPAPTRYP